MSIEEMSDLFVEIVKSFPALEVAALFGRDGGAILLGFNTRTVVVPIIDRETTLQAAVTFAMSVGAYVTGCVGYNDWLN